MPNRDNPLADPSPMNAALAERAHQLSVIFDSIADVTFVLNVEDDGRYRFIFANKAFEKTTGLSLEKVAGSYVEDIIPEPSLSLVRAKYREAVVTLARVVWQETTAFPTGPVTGEVSVTPVCDAAGRCRQLVGIVHDLTREKQIEEALRRSNTRFAYALKATTDAIYEWNVADDTLYWGEGFEELFGHKLVQNPTSFSKWADFVDPAESQRVVLGLRRAAHETTALFWQEEYRFLRADGTWAVVFDRGNILRNATGQAVRMIGAMQDITLRKQAETQQRLLAEKLMKQNAYLQQCGYLISHNLRAPLANALGFTDLLARVDKESEVFADCLKNLRISLHRLDDVLTDVNAILTVPDQQEVDATEPVALAAVCQQALDHAQPELQEAGAQVACRIAEDVQIPGIHAFFHSIFDNLISNAVKYRAVTRPLKIEITATTGLHQDTTIVFSDNGSGFDQEQAGDVFQLYRRLQVDKPGRGIGLYLIKNHVEAMGGQITVQSQVNQGTQFILYFSPRADENLPD